MPSVRLPDWLVVELDESGSGQDRGRRETQMTWSSENEQKVDRGSSGGEKVVVEVGDGSISG